MSELLIDQKRYKADLRYHSITVSKFVNMSMERGRKTAARKNIYEMLAILEKETKQDPVKFLEQSLENIAPNLEVRSVRIGGANYQVPVPVSGMRKVTLSMRWLLNAARAKKGRPIAQKLADEIMLAYKNEGSAIKKRIDVQKMAEANKAFAHFGRIQ